MKSINFLIGIFILLFNLPGISQENWSSFSTPTGVDITKQQGKKFKLEAYIKSEGIEDEASTSLWVRVEKANGKIGFLKSMQDQPIKLSEWKKYTIEGTIDEDVQKLNFGLLSVYNGNFYCDDIRISVLNDKNKWELVYLEDFEKGITNLTQGNQKKKPIINTLFTSYVENTQKAPSGKYYLRIHGENIPNYGQNKEHGKFANVNGIKLYYEIYGEGEPLLVLHGNGGSISSASAFYPDLIKKYKVIAVDSRAQGKSTDTDKALTYDQMASDLNELLNELKIDSVNVLGHSDGGILSVLLAKDYPKKVKRALACGTNIQPDSLAVFNWAIEFVEKKIQDIRTDTKQKKLFLLLRDYPNLKFTDLDKIKAPILIMSGDRDIIRPEHTLKLYQNIPNSQLCILPGTTHGVPWEKKELFLNILYDFFDKPFKMPNTRDQIKN